jgi:ribosomal-protein-alanine N-acetyltransferase
MHPMMMETADRDQVVDVGDPEVVPLREVMDVAAIEMLIAPVDRTCPIHRAESNPLRRRRQTLGSTDVQRPAVAAQHDGDDVRITRMAPGGFGRYRCAIGVFRHRVVVHAVDQGLVVDQDCNLGGPHSRARPMSAHQAVESPGHQLIPSKPSELWLFGQNRDLGIERSPNPVALLRSQLREQVVHAGVVIDLDRRRYSILLSGGALEAVIGGDVIDQLPQPAPEQLWRMGRGELDDLLILRVQVGTLIVAQPTSSSCDRVRVLDADLSLSQRIVQFRCLTQHPGAAFCLLRRPPRRPTTTSQYVNRRRSLTSLMELGDPTHQRSLELIGRTPNHRDIAQRAGRLGGRQHRRVTCLQLLQTSPRCHADTLSNVCSLPNSTLSRPSRRNCLGVSLRGRCQYEWMDQRAAQACEFETGRLRAGPWHSIAYGAGVDLVECVAEMLTESTTVLLPETWHGDFSVDRAVDWIDERDRESPTLLVVDRESGQVVGLVILFESAIDEPSVDVRIGYLFAEAVWGQGLATELVAGLVGWARAHPPIRTLTAGVAVTNPASARVLVTNGFERIVAGEEETDAIYQLLIERESG